MKIFRATGWIAFFIGAMFLIGGCGGGAAEVAEAPTATVPPTPAGDPIHGQELYEKTCIACHGPGGIGIEGLGKDMTASEFIRNQTDDDMVDFIKSGRPSSDPLNTTGIDMPPKGGNPALSDEDLEDIVAYIRSLQK